MGKLLKSHRRRSAFLGGLVALVSLVATAATAAPVAAEHDGFRRVSAGEGGRGNLATPAFFSSTSADGKHVFFITSERLLLLDTDNRVDVYERFGSTLRRVSVGSINGNGAFDAGFVGATANGLHAFFVTGEQLVASDTDSSLDLYERFNGTTSLVSTGQINGNGAFTASFARSSTDGSRVFFTTAEKLDPADTDAVTDVYERSAGTTKLVSAGQINGNGGFSVFFSGASDGGGRVWFTTSEPLVADDTDTQIDIYERSNGTTKRVSIGTINGNGAFDAAFSGASSDGLHVFFTSLEKLVAGDTDDVQDVYEFSGGTVTKDSIGNGAFAASFDAASADGTKVFFSTSEPIGTDTDSATDIYQRSGGVTTRVSAGAINGNGAANSLFEKISTDGLHVFFDTTEQLVSGDTDAALDIYDRSAGVTQRVTAGTINGNGNFATSFNDISADGSHVFFSTAEQLVTDDGDALSDIYERVAGQTFVVSIGDGPFTPAFRRGSADGTAVFFETSEKVMADDKDAVVDVYGAYEDS